MPSQARDSVSVATLEIVSKAIGGVSPIGWITSPDIALIDEALNEYSVIWAAAGHPHGVFPTSFAELRSATDASPMKVGE